MVARVWKERRRERVDKSRIAASSGERSGGWVKFGGTVKCIVVLI